MTLSEAFKINLSNTRLVCLRNHRRRRQPLRHNSSPNQTLNPAQFDLRSVHSKPPRRSPPPPVSAFCCRPLFARPLQGFSRSCSPPRQRQRLARQRATTGTRSHELRLRPYCSISCAWTAVYGRPIGRQWRRQGELRALSFAQGALERASSSSAAFMDSMDAKTLFMPRRRPPLAHAAPLRTSATGAMFPQAAVGCDKALWRR